MVDGQCINTVIAYNKFGGYSLPKSSLSRPAAKAIFSGEVWEHQTLEYLIANVQGGDIVTRGNLFR